VTALVTDGAERKEDPAITFARVQGQADAAAGQPSRPAPELPPDRWRPPRLTEPWFC